MDMINIHVSFPASSVENKSPNVSIAKKRQRRKPKDKSITSKLQEGADGQNVAANESNKTKDKVSQKNTAEKKKLPVTLVPLAQGCATSTGAIPKVNSSKPSKKAKKKAEAAAALLKASNTMQPIPNSKVKQQQANNGVVPKGTPKFDKKAHGSQLIYNSNIKQHQSENGAIPKESPKSAKKAYVFHSHFYKGLSAFNNLPRNTNNIWKPPKKKVQQESNEQENLSDDGDISPPTFICDIKRIRKPSTGRFYRKKSSNENVNLHKFGPKFPVIFNSQKNSESPNDWIDELCDKINEVLLDSSSVTNNLDISVQEDELSSTMDTTVNTSIDLDSSCSNRMNNSIAQTKQRKSRRGRIRIKKEIAEEVFYPKYMDSDEVDEGLKNGLLIKGLIRINPRNCKEAYVTSMVKGDSDYIIKSVIEQNRALEGDEVILKVKPEAEWDGGRKTAFVVYISKMINSRTTVGKLTALHNNEQFAAVQPRDKKFPTIYIPTISWPPGFKTNPKGFEKNLFLVKITEWTNLNHAKGLIIENIGVAGDLKIENLAILKSCGLDYEPFGNNILQYLPKSAEFQTEWLEGREDLRKECIFTIDPLTARDLDDAVSCKKLPDGNFEVGVHIADVTFFLQEGTELDKQVAWKATTIYMVNNVYHMLPVELCMNCSLLPGKDKLSFSVFWIMTPEGEILSTRFARTVINSCSQFAYEHAQAIIDDPQNFDRSSLPKIENGYTVEDAKNVILGLYHISRNLRQKRFDNGALRINQVKLSYELDPATGHPVKYFIQEIKEANQLIEEFMLLANMSVAEKTLEHFPDVAFLRMHEPPKLNMLVELKRALESVGIHVDISSSKSIHNSLLKYASDDQAGEIRSVVLNHLFAKAMTRARYFCPEVEVASNSYSHYALNVPLYTHFTSPIRRYADVMVHRLLAACLGLAEKPKMNSMEVFEVASRCNLIKYNAKKAQEESSHLYLCHYIMKNAPFIKEAAVVEVRERSFDVIVLECGEVVRIHLNDIEGASYTVEDITNIDMDASEREREIQKKYWRVTLTYPATKQYPAVMTVLEIFTLLKVQLRPCPKTRKIVGRLVRPES